MTTNIHTSTISASKKRRIYSAEFKVPYPATFNSSTATAGMLHVHITLPDSSTEIGLKWQASEMSALAELLKALAT